MSILDVNLTILIQYGITFGHRAKLWINVSSAGRHLSHVAEISRCVLYNLSLCNEDSGEFLIGSNRALHYENIDE